jgi:lysophospholipase L1-like esterase
MKLLRRSLGPITLIFIVVLGMLLIFEGVLWVIDYRYTPLRIKLQKSSDWRQYHAFEDRNFIYDPELIWRPRPSSGIFNEQGYRGESLATERQPLPARIFAIGDSNTLGWAGKDGPNWPKYLEDRLNEGGLPSVVINAGVYGYTSYQGLQRFKETLVFSPDIALISFGANDAHRTLMSDAEFASRGIREDRWDKVLVKFRLGQMVLAAFDNYSGANKETLIPRVSVEEYEHNLREIIRLAREHHIRVVLLTRPFIGSSPNALWWKNFAAEYNAATMKLAARENVPVIDVYSYFRNCEACFADESHFTEKGMHMAAEIVYRKIATIHPARTSDIDQRP